MEETRSRWPEEEYPHKDLTHKILAAAINVHKALGPGFIESIYENALVHELQKMGLAVRQQIPIEVFYDSVKVGEHRIDLLVNELVVLELKAVGELAPVHGAQTRSTLKAARLQVALLINFNVTRLMDGVKRIIA